MEIPTKLVSPVELRHRIQGPLSAHPRRGSLVVPKLEIVETILRKEILKGLELFILEMAAS